IRTDFDDFVANLAASADKPSKEVATSKPAAKGKAKKEPVDPVEAARAVLSDYLDEEGNPVIEESDIKGFDMARLQALADFLGVDRPKGGLMEVRKAMIAVVAEATDG